MNVTSIINITDAMMIAMCVPNIIALYILAPEIKKDLKNYCQRYKIGTLVNRKWIAESESAAVPVKEKSRSDDQERRYCRSIFKRRRIKPRRRFLRRNPS